MTNGPEDPPSREPSSGFRSSARTARTDPAPPRGSAPTPTRRPASARLDGPYSLAPLSLREGPRRDSNLEPWRKPDVSGAAITYPNAGGAEKARAGARGGTGTAAHAPRSTAPGPPPEKNPPKTPDDPAGREGGATGFERGHETKRRGRTPARATPEPTGRGRRALGGARGTGRRGGYPRPNPL
jgi:hypothetical protein